MPQKEKLQLYTINDKYIKYLSQYDNHVSWNKKPVPENEIELIDYDVRGEKYKNLLQAEINFINEHKINVYSKAKKMYRNITKIKIPFFINISCNYKLLEEKCTIYINSNN